MKKNGGQKVQSVQKLFFQVNEFRKNQVAIIEVFNETKFLPENHLNREN